MLEDVKGDELLNRLIDVLQSEHPDFELAEELIKQGADLNMTNEDGDENILSNILWSFGRCNYICSDCENEQCDTCINNASLRSDIGETMCEVIRFALAHGFDVNGNNGRNGAQCLYALTLSTCDKYIIDATKILLDAGAKNGPTSHVPTENDETAWDFMGMEGFYQGTCEHNFALANIYEAVYQIYQAVEDGRPYAGIDFYGNAIGKKILKVLTAKGDNEIGESIHTVALPAFQKGNCFDQNLYFIYEGGILIISPYIDLWTDDILPVGDLIDVSEYCQDMIGGSIEHIDFDHNVIVKGNTHYTQPIANMYTDNGYRIIFSCNFGEVEKSYQTAYFDISCSD